MIIPRVRLLKENREAMSPPRIKEDVANRPQKSACSISIELLSSLPRITGPAVMARYFLTIFSLWKVISRNRAYSIVYFPSFTLIGRAFQILSQYSLMDRSEENLPIRATFRIDIRVHFA